MDFVLCVEGMGDRQAVPVLFRRVLEERFALYGIEFTTHRRNGIESLRAKSWKRFRRYLQAARTYNAPILWVVDLDDGCAWKVAEEMHAIVRDEELDVPFAGVLWVREYESLFLADAETTGGKLNADVATLRSVVPEEVRGAKGVISRAMSYGSIYKETLHQESVTAVVDIPRAERRSRSLRHFISAVEWLTTQTSGCYPIKPYSGT